ncbi:MAG: FtsQ-type POTRA domain-containing protein [Desulfobacteraceae bacterium]|nr:FtsQ-type POTRA domain-containing protein [Desulfobacteraceae bacterium]
MNKKPKQNKYKPEPSLSKGKLVPASQKRTRKIFISFGLLILMSLGAIWIYDAITQCPFFTIKQVDISGTKRLEKNEILQLMGVTKETNLFEININTIEQKIICHPWVAKALVKRSFFSTLVVTVVEEDPLAIVNIENMTNIIINTQGHPFKEYEPQKDKLNFLPVISGIDLTQDSNTYKFKGPLFNSIMNLMEIKGFGRIDGIMGDETIGITIKTQDIYNKNPENIQEIIPVKLGFDQFEEKQIKAIKISTYINTHFPDKTISAMDLFNIEKIFVTTKETNTLHHNIYKGA